MAQHQAAIAEFGARCTDRLEHDPRAGRPLFRVDAPKEPGGRIETTVSGVEAGLGTLHAGASGASHVRVPLDGQRQWSLSRVLLGRRDSRQKACRGDADNGEAHGLQSVDVRHPLQRRRLGGHPPIRRALRWVSVLRCPNRVSQEIVVRGS